MFVRLIILGSALALAKQRSSLPMRQRKTSTAFVQPAGPRDVLFESVFSITQQAPSNNVVVLDYSLFRNATSSLRKLPPELNRHVNIQRQQQQKGWKQLVSILLLLRGNADAAHEMILGINGNNMIEAERVAALSPEDRKAYRWIDKHPLSDTDDWIHSLIHRREGFERGEGNHTGWDNAKYWAGGGPKHEADEKQQDGDVPRLCHHPVAKKLAAFVTQHAPMCLKHGLVPTHKSATHNIIVGGGQQRQVRVPSGCFDIFVFVDLLSDMMSSKCGDDASSPPQQGDCSSVLGFLRHELDEIQTARDPVVGRALRVRWRKLWGKPTSGLTVQNESLWKASINQDIHEPAQHTTASFLFG